MSEVAGQVEQRAAHLRELGRYADAERTVRAVLAEHLGNGDLLCELALSLVGQKRLDEALEAADAAVAAAPQGEWAHRVRAVALTELGRHDDAVDAAWAAVELAPNGEFAASVYARALRRAGRLPEAVSAACRYADLAPHSTDAHLQVADVAWQVGDEETARQAYQEALRLDPESAIARHNLGMLDLHSGRTTEAVRGFLDAGALDPGMAPTVLANVTVVLGKVSWWLQLWLGGTSLVVLRFGGTRFQSSWAAQLCAGLVLLIGLGLAWWHCRDLPPGVKAVATAALRTNKVLFAAYLGLAVAALLYVAIVVTGLAVLAFGVMLATYGALALTTLAGSGR